MIIVICLISLIGVYCLYLLYRNDQVYKFRVKVLNLCFIYDRKYPNDNLSHLWNEISSEMGEYDLMVLSFKKLTLENWVKEENIEKLKLVMNECT